MLKQMALSAVLCLIGTAGYATEVIKEEIVAPADALFANEVIKEEIVAPADALFANEMIKEEMVVSEEGMLLAAAPAPAKTPANTKNGDDDDSDDNDDDADSDDDEDDSLFACPECGGTCGECEEKEHVVCNADAEMKKDCESDSLLAGCGCKKKKKNA